MSQRDSGYARKERDLYETPEWATEAVLPHLPTGIAIWEPAAASGKMARVLAAKLATDIDAHGGHLNFLTQTMPLGLNAIITNPPYELAQEFIQHALHLTKPEDGMVGMLLRTDYDHAVSRQHLFSACPQFKKKLVLTKRIKWFENSDGQPSFNHAWFIWDWKHRGPPTLAYGPQKTLTLFDACADPASDDLTVEFGIKLSGQDAEIERMRAELATHNSILAINEEMWANTRLRKALEEIERLTGDTTMSTWDTFGGGSRNKINELAREALGLPEPEPLELVPLLLPYCPFCKKRHPGGNTCMGHHP